jgi:16S rRNA (uracil1498-N3)-methyltransferase
MHRFYLPPSAVRDDLLRLSDAEAHHAIHVVRVRLGERVVVMDGVGHELLCEVTGTGRHQVDLAVRQRVELPRLPFRLTLLQAITKAKSMDLIIQKATELGAARVVPIVSERSVARPDPDHPTRKVEQWRAVAIEAIKQCGAPWLPELDAPVPPAAFVAARPPCAVMLLASLQPGARHPRECLRAAREQGQMPPNDVAVWVGPEGDFTPAELQTIQSAGAQPIRLGPLVLRSETAALYCLAFLSYELQG